MSLTYGRNGNISFATASISGKSNEDRDCAYFNHVDDYFSKLPSRYKNRSNKSADKKQDLLGFEGDISSFGIFDGHNGSYGSDYCSKILHHNIVAKYLQASESISSMPLFFEDQIKSSQRQGSSSNEVEDMEESQSSLPHRRQSVSPTTTTNSTDSSFSLTQSEIHFSRAIEQEGLFCHTIHTQIAKSSMEIQKLSDAGTTMTSVFCFQHHTTYPYNHLFPPEQPPTDSTSSTTSTPLNKQVPAGSSSLPQKKEDGYTRIIIANVGDSRCIAVTGLPPLTTTTTTSNNSNTTTATATASTTSHSTHSTIATPSTTTAATGHIFSPSNNKHHEKPIDERYLSQSAHEKTSSFTTSSTTLPLTNTHHQHHHKMTPPSDALNITTHGYPHHRPSSSHHRSTISSSTLTKNVLDDSMHDWLPSLPPTHTSTNTNTNTSSTGINIPHRPNKEPSTTIGMMISPRKSTLSTTIPSLITPITPRSMHEISTTVVGEKEKEEEGSVTGWLSQQSSTRQLPTQPQVQPHRHNMSTRASWSASTTSSHDDHGRNTISSSPTVLTTVSPSYPHVHKRLVQMNTASTATSSSTTTTITSASTSAATATTTSSSVWSAENKQPIYHLGYHIPSYGTSFCTPTTSPIISSPIISSPVLPTRLRTKCIPLTEDHNMQNIRERYRISEGITLLPQPLPYEIAYQSTYAELFTHHILTNAAATSHQTLIGRDEGSTHKGMICPIPVHQLCKRIPKSYQLLDPVASLMASNKEGDRKEADTEGIFYLLYTGYQWMATIEGHNTTKQQQQHVIGEYNKGNKEMRKNAFDDHHISNASIPVHTTSSSSNSSSNSSNSNSSNRQHLLWSCNKNDPFLQHILLSALLHQYIHTYYPFTLLTSSEDTITSFSTSTTHSSSSSVLLQQPPYLLQSYAIHESLQDTYTLARQSSYIGPRIHSVTPPTTLITPPTTSSTQKPQKTLTETPSETLPGGKCHTQTIAKVGPMAYFSRFHRSLLMTRSIGDRFGPRHCLSTAELTAINVPNTVFMRLIIASDGVWDVIDNHTIRRMAMYYQYVTPTSLASAIAKKAQARREKLHLRLDDITVTVIECNTEMGSLVKVKYTEEEEEYPAIPLRQLLKRQKQQQHQGERGKRRGEETSTSTNSSSSGGSSSTLPTICTAAAAVPRPVMDIHTSAPSSSRSTPLTTGTPHSHSHTTPGTHSSHGRKMMMSGLLSLTTTTTAPPSTTTSSSLKSVKDELDVTMHTSSMNQHSSSSNSSSSRKSSRQQQQQQQQQENGAEEEEDIGEEDIGEEEDGQGILQVDMEEEEGILS